MNFSDGAIFKNSKNVLAAYRKLEKKFVRARKIREYFFSKNLNTHSPAKQNYSHNLKKTAKPQ